MLGKIMVLYLSKTDLNTKRKVTCTRVDLEIVCKIDPSTCGEFGPNEPTRAVTGVFVFIDSSMAFICEWYDL